MLKSCNNCSYFFFPAPVFNIQCYELAIIGFIDLIQCQQSLQKKRLEKFLELVALRTGTVGRYMKVILIERAIEILLSTTSTYQSEGSCSQGNSGVAGKASKAVHSLSQVKLLEHKRWI